MNHFMLDNPVEACQTLQIDLNIFFGDTRGFSIISQLMKSKNFMTSKEVFVLSSYYEMLFIIKVSFSINKYMQKVSYLCTLYNVLCFSFSPAPPDVLIHGMIYLDNTQ